MVAPRTSKYPTRLRPATALLLRGAARLWKVDAAGRARARPTQDGLLSRMLRLYYVSAVRRLGPARISEILADHEPEPSGPIPVPDRGCSISDTTGRR